MCVRGMNGEGQSLPLESSFWELTLRWSGSLRMAPAWGENSDTERSRAVDIVVSYIVVTSGDSRQWLYTLLSGCWLKQICRVTSLTYLRKHAATAQSAFIRDRGHSKGHTHTTRTDERMHNKISSLQLFCPALTLPQPSAHLPSHLYRHTTTISPHLFTEDYMQ